VRRASAELVGRPRRHRTGGTEAGQPADNLNVKSAKRSQVPPARRRLRSRGAKLGRDSPASLGCERPGALITGRRATRAARVRNRRAIPIVPRHRPEAAVRRHDDYTASIGVHGASMSTRDNCLDLDPPGSAASPAFAPEASAAGRRSSFSQLSMAVVVAPEPGRHWRGGGPKLAQVGAGSTYLTLSIF
jgi:hypothetical protein